MTNPIEPPLPPSVPAPVNPYAQPSAGPVYAPQEVGPGQGLSIASLCLGIGGLILLFFGFGFLPALAAVITGHMAQKRQPLSRPFWLTGLITGYVGLGISVIFGILVVVLGGLFFWALTGVGS